MSFSDKIPNENKIEHRKEEMYNDFPYLQTLISELAQNLEKINHCKDRESWEEMNRENQKLFDNISLALKRYKY